ncbi:hypothetical protein ACQ4M4_25365 [Leptolyngbya sp. AN02str]|uniref:hypothetical protein n=1 Tax=Leptolyngbya sp. AN02str TaxID=3423363 RepID=UPI003D3192DC
MPGSLLHVGATVICAHGGQGQPTAPNPRVKVMGQPIVTQTAPYTVTACVNSPSPPNLGPCMAAQWVTGALRVRSMGQPVLLQDSQSLCAPTGTPLSVVIVQLRVRGQ